MGSINDIGTPGSPLSTPPLTVWQAAVRDVLGGSDVPVNLKIAQAIKASDQTGIASGGSAGITCTLPGLRVGGKVLGILQIQAVATSGSVPATAFLSTTGLTGATVVGAPSVRHTIAALNQGPQLTGFWLFTASAASMSTGMAMTLSSSGQWTCLAGSSITLISL